MVVQELIECLISMEMEEVMEESGHRTETSSTEGKNKESNNKRTNPDTEDEKMELDSNELSKRMDDKVIAKQNKENNEETVWLERRKLEVKENTVQLKSAVNEENNKIHKRYSL